MLARFSIPACTRPARALGHSVSLRSLLCPRQESNLHRQLRKLMSYPLNDEGEVRKCADTSSGKRTLRTNPRMPPYEGVR